MPDPIEHEISRRYFEQLGALAPDYVPDLRPYMPRRGRPLRCRIFGHRYATWLETTLDIPDELRPHPADTKTQLRKKIDVLMTPYCRRCALSRFELSRPAPVPGPFAVAIALAALSGAIIALCVVLSR